MRVTMAGRSVLARVVTTLALCAALCGGALAKTVNLTDATNGLAAAIAAAGPNGTVHLRGVIREQQSVELPYRVHLRGLNSGGKQPVLIIQPTDNLNAIVVLGSDAEVSNLNIQPSSSLYGDLGTAAFVLGSRFRFTSNTVSGWRVGLFFSGADSGTVASNTFAASPVNLDLEWAGAGIYSQFTIGRLDITTNQFHGYYVGLYVQDSVGHQIHNNRLEKGEFGIWMDGAVKSGLATNTVAGSAVVGILLTEGASEVNARGNMVSGSGGDSIVAEAGTSGNFIRNNRVDKPVKNLGNNTVENNRLG